MARADGIRCQNLVELVTEYLEQALPPELQLECATHLRTCAACGAYVEQMRLAIRALGTLIEASTSLATQDELIAAFRARQRPT